MGWTMPLCNDCIKEIEERGERIRIFNQRDCNCYYCGKETDGPVYDTWRE